MSVPENATLTHRMDGIATVPESACQPSEKSREFISMLRVCIAGKKSKLNVLSFDLFATLEIVFLKILPNLSFDCKRSFCSVENKLITCGFAVNLAEEAPGKERF